jgi:hypothetical protein
MLLATVIYLEFLTDKLKNEDPNKATKQQWSMHGQLDIV